MTVILLLNPPYCRCPRIYCFFCPGAYWGETGSGKFCSRLHPPRIFLAGLLRNLSFSFFSHIGIPVCIKCFFFSVFYVVLCLLFFLTFWGTLPCGSHLLNYVSPKRRKCKAKCVVVVKYREKNLNVMLVKKQVFLCRRLITRQWMSSLYGIISDEKMEKRIVFRARISSNVVISQLLNVYMLSCFRK